jgi:hypothetical protein
VWSGSAKMSAGWRVGDKISICNNKVQLEKSCFLDVQNCLLGSTAV